MADLAKALTEYARTGKLLITQLDDWVLYMKTSQNLICRKLAKPMWLTIIIYSRLIKLEINEKSKNEAIELIQNVWSQLENVEYGLLLTRDLMKWHCLVQCENMENFEYYIDKKINDSLYLMAKILENFEKKKKENQIVVADEKMNLKMIIKNGIRYMSNRESVNCALLLSEVDYLYNILRRIVSKAVSVPAEIQIKDTNRLKDNVNKIRMMLGYDAKTAVMFTGYVKTVLDKLENDSQNSIKNMAVIMDTFAKDVEAAFNVAQKRLNHWEEHRMKILDNFEKLDNWADQEFAKVSWPEDIEDAQ